MKASPFARRVYPAAGRKATPENEAMANIAVAIREYLDAEIEPEDGAEIREIEVAV
ncbi:MAG: hypothetical protein WED34_21660 [Planctomycetales bacterium]